MSKVQSEVKLPAIPPLRPKVEEIFEEANALSGKIADRAYQIFESRGSGHGSAMNDWLEAECELLTPLAVEILQTRDTIRVKAKAPGFTAKDIRIAVEPWRCVIAGRIRSEPVRVKGEETPRSPQERRICRLVQLPVQVRPDAAVFDVRNGVIELTLLRAAESRKSTVDAA